MRVRILQHTPQTPAGTVLEWLALKGHPHQIDRLYEGAPLPALDDFDFLISLGGEMNCDQHEAHPFLQGEKALLAGAIERRKAVLGICLGGQLLARALGATVGRSAQGWEVGWHPVQVSTSQRLVVFQYHQDSFELPSGARSIASNQFSLNQGFVFGDRAVGLQFHPEATEEWISACCADAAYPQGPFVQSAPSVIAEFGYLVPARKWFFGLLDQLESAAGRN